MALLPLIALSMVAPAAADCPDPSTEVDTVEQAVLDARFEDARATMARVEAAFGCTGTADSQLLARLWLAEGAMAHIEGDPASRDQAFASAARISPDTWTEAFGPDLQALWQAASQTPTGTGQLELEGLAEDAVALVDGKPVQVPAQLASGLYLVQADADGGPPVFARIVLVPDDQTLVVRVEEPIAIDSSTTVEPSNPRKKRWPWFAAAGGTAVLAGTSALLASTQVSTIEQATTSEDLNSALGRQRVFAYSGYGLAGVSAVLLGVGFVW